MVHLYRAFCVFFKCLRRGPWNKQRCRKICLQPLCRRKLPSAPPELHQIVPIFAYFHLLSLIFYIFPYYRSLDRPRGNHCGTMKNCVGTYVEHVGTSGTTMCERVDTMWEHVETMRFNNVWIRGNHVGITWEHVETMSNHAWFPQGVRIVHACSLVRTS